jgi:hypothetical protein
MKQQQLTDEARRAVDRLRDFAREHGMSHHQRDPLVMDIHRALDAFDSAARAASLPQAEPRTPEIEILLRKEWWFNHACEKPNLYGDDGEMQCNVYHGVEGCMSFIDFKRMPFDDLHRVVGTLRMIRTAKAVEQHLRAEPPTDLRTLIETLKRYSAAEIAHGSRLTGLSVEPFWIRADELEAAVRGAARPQTDVVKALADSASVGYLVDGEVDRVGVLHMTLNVIFRRAGVIMPACDGPDCKVCPQLVGVAALPSSPTTKGEK